MTDRREGADPDGPLRPPPEERSPAELLAFGVVNLDKPPGPSAHQVSAWVRDLAGVERAAHAGTLDPSVTGCLPVLTGDATRVARALLGPKEYVAVLELHRRAPEDLDVVVEAFEGPILQRPPRKSAVDRSPRVRRVYDLTAVESESRRLLLRVDCESGTYVRKLCHDLGLALGTGANMGDLRRTAADPFDDTDLVTLHDLADVLAFHEAGDPEPLYGAVDPAERALEALPSVTIARSAAREVAEGAPVYAPGVLEVDDADANADEEPLVACYTPDGAAVCLGRLVGDPDADEGTVVDLERVLV
ncbi:RNA-guided pseudouridylation complex pseudouridine synthase subunit Cbf5 [Halobacteriales archaeon SW_7_71_33]|nr:MAG: RNA-guided pseudouridylation complex pseudouridine synthase subunit Cbf5 [Halobacteriales archaeon SW_7_71_33]